MAETGTVRRYHINLEGEEFGGRRKAMSAFIAARRCFACQQSLTGEMVFGGDPQDHVDQIVAQCAGTPDYLLPDTPLKEAIFRTLLANGNGPMTAREVSDALMARWSMSAYPRDIAAKTVAKILDHSEGYSIVWADEQEAVAPAPARSGKPERRR
ncbi:MAG: hypothetical protein FJ319_09710 [SAR202 cluster bacterium]|nr:hypothetical protein [SAR202 cluster bacterium]